MPSTPLTRQPAPALEVETLDHGAWSLAQQQPETFTLVVFYRGLHCPVCSKYVAELDAKLPQLRERGVEVIAVSGDDRERAAESRDRWGLGRLTVGYGATAEQMSRWGLYLSGAIKDGDPSLFGEPGAFLVGSDGTLWLAAIGSAPFARPHVDDLIAAVDFAVEKDYPARGELEPAAVA